MASVFLVLDVDRVWSTPDWVRLNNTCESQRECSTVWARSQLLLGHMRAVLGHKLNVAGLKHPPVRTKLDMVHLDETNVSDRGSWGTSLSGCNPCQ